MNLHKPTPPAGQVLWNRLVTSVPQVRRDQKEPGPTESDRGRARGLFLLSGTAEYVLAPNASQCPCWTVMDSSGTSAETQGEGGKHNGYVLGPP